MTDPRENWPDPTPERLLQMVLDKLLEEHPWPWHLERGWGYEVLDDQGGRVLLCAMEKDAEALCVGASRRHAERLQAEAELQAGLEDEDEFL